LVKDDLAALIEIVERVPEAPGRLSRLFRVLEVAIWLKRNDILEQLIQYGGPNLDLNSISNFRSPLSIAARTENLEILDLLVRRGADVNTMDSMGETAIMAAAQRGDAVTVERLLKHGAVTRTVGEHGTRSALEAALGNGRGHWEVAKLLVEYGTDPNEKISDDPLLVAAARVGHVPLVQTLLAQGASVDAESKRPEQTALMAAARGGCIEIVQLLLRAGADSQSHLGRLAVAEAIRSRNAEIVDALLNAGADVNGELEGETPLVAAAGYGIQMNVVRALLARGADANATHFGQPLIVEAAEYGFREQSLELILALLNHGADVNARGEREYTAWLWADAWGLTDIASALQQYGADTKYRPDLPLPAAAWAIVSEATTVDTFRVDPEHQQRLPLHHIGGYAITSVGSVQPQAFADRIAHLLLDHRTYMGEPNMCGFQPGVAFRLHADTKKVEILLCFHCHEALLSIHDEAKKHEPFGIYFGRQYGNFVKLAQAAFPTDQDLAALSKGKDVRA
jgi:ankyrin repeat protein